MSSPDAPPSLDVAIIGAGLAGICLAILLKRAGIDNFAIVEKSDGIGGTWRDNTYPGAACDVPSHLYSFSFAPKLDWRRKYATQAEILGYIEDLARTYDLHPHLRLGTELAGAQFDTGNRCWRLRTVRGEAIAAKALVSGCGQLNRPRYPEIPGRALFAGRAFHSARWDHSYDLRGKRVAVIGTGASAVQFIPQIAPVVAKLHVFQRSANWLVPRGDRAYSPREQWLFRHLPLAERLHRYAIYWQFESRFAGFGQGSRVGRIAAALATKHLRRQVGDPDLRQKLLPDYPIGCKRVLIADDYYPALQRPNVELVTTAIERLTRDAIVTADGVERPVDAVIYATGFESTKFLAPMAITGVDGIPIERRWSGGAEAYLGMAVPGYPNFFLMYGPNTNLGHNSIIFMIECQAAYITRCLRRLLRGGSVFEVKAEAMRRYQARLERAMARTVWAAGCNSWYKTAAGKITNNWSGFTVEYWWRTRRPRFADFQPM
jgi:cation diffusion facilitator CzcD-associated flavoprotein CzcO